MTTRAERAPPPWRKLGAHVSSSEDPSMKGVLVGRPSQMYWDVRTTTDAIVTQAGPARSHARDSPQEKTAQGS